MKMRHLHSAGICRAAGSVANRMLLLCMLGIAMPQATFAAVNSVEQRASVSGVIIDANTQETIVGASVLVKGTTLVQLPILTVSSPWQWISYR